MISAKKIFYAMNVANVLLCLLIIGSVVLGTSLIKQQSAKLVQIKTQNKVMDEQQIQLTQAKKDIESYSELDNLTRSIVPQDKDQAKTVREITKLAQESGITLKSVAFDSSNLGQTSTAQPTQSSDDSGGSTPKPAPAPSLSQVKPVEGIAGVYALQITVTSLETAPIPYDKFLSFLEKLEGNRRTAHVDSLTIKPTDTGDALSFALTLNAYVKP